MLRCAVHLRSVHRRDVSPPASGSQVCHRTVVDGDEGKTVDGTNARVPIQQDSTGDQRNQTDRMFLEKGATVDVFEKGAK